VATRAADSGNSNSDKDFAPTELSEGVRYGSEAFDTAPNLIGDGCRTNLLSLERGFFHFRRLCPSIICLGN